MAIIMGGISAKANAAADESSTAAPEGLNDEDKGEGVRGKEESGSCKVDDERTGIEVGRCTVGIALKLLPLTPRNITFPYCPEALSLPVARPLLRRC